MSDEKKIYPFTNDVIFKAVMKDESIAAWLVGTILGRKVAKIENLVPQKEVKITRSSRGVYFDLYFEDDSAVYDVEMQNLAPFDMGRRCRYYQSMIDSDILSTGKDYKELKNSYIIFLCTYDPFKLERPIYTFENVCTDDEKCAIGDALRLETGATIVICNALAYDKTSDDLQILLKYLTTHKAEKNNDFIEQIDEAVLYANNDKEIRRKAEMYDLKLQDAKDAGIAIGMEQGKKHWMEQERRKMQDARREGIAIGMERGKKHWLQQGMEQDRIKLVDILDYDNIGLSDEQKKIILAEFSRSAD